MDDTVEGFMETLRKKFICRENKKAVITSYLFGYTKNPTSDNFLRRNVFNDLSAIVSEESYYTLNIFSAKEFFKDNIEKLYHEKQDNIEAIVELYSKLTQQLKFQLIEVGQMQNDEYNIILAFETINNRGRQLSNLEKLKNRLIYLTTLDEPPNGPCSYDGNHPNRRKIKKAWSEIYRQLGRNTRKTSNGKIAVLDDDDFLRTHWILNYQFTKKTGNDYAEYLLDNKFTVQNVRKNLAYVESTQEFVHDSEDDDFEEMLEQNVKVEQKEPSLDLAYIHDYVTDLQNMAGMWYYTWFPNDAKNVLSSEEIEWMVRINRIGITYFRPLITALFFERLIKNTVTKDDCLKLLEAIERFIFIVFKLQAVRRSDYGTSDFNRVARELHKGTKTVDDVLKMIQDRIAYSFETDEETGQEYFKTLNMQVLVNKLFEQKKDERTGYYRWSAIHYFLFEYNANLSKEGYHGSTVTWDSFKQSEKDKISIEHICPHNVTGYWAEKFKDISQDDLPIYQGSLGNLLLLSQKINAVLQDDDFDTKKKGRQSEDKNKYRIGYNTGSYSELEVSKYDDWTSESIKERGLKMMKFMEERWNFKFKSDEDKLALLFPKK